MSKWKETIRRAARTFFQAAVGYIAANLVMMVTGAGNDSEALKSTLITLITAAVACGLAAVMNMPQKEDGKGEDENEC